MGTACASSSFALVLIEALAQASRSLRRWRLAFVMLGLVAGTAQAAPCLPGTLATYLGRSASGCARWACCSSRGSRRKGRKRCNQIAPGNIDSVPITISQRAAYSASARRFFQG